MTFYLFMRFAMRLLSWVAIAVIPAWLAGQRRRHGTVVRRSVVDYPKGSGRARATGARNISRNETGSAGATCDRRRNFKKRKRFTERSIALTGVFGKASFSYSAGKTASGEIFNRTRLTAAHRSLPFGTRLRVAELATANQSSFALRIAGRSCAVARRRLEASALWTPA